jgi:hypothetical protein
MYLNNNKTQMGLTWVGDVPTMFYKIRNYLDHPHVSRITLLTFVSLRRSVWQPGSSFAKFIKSYGPRFFVKSGLTIH